MTESKNLNRGRAVLMLALLLIFSIAILMLTNTDQMPVVQGIIETVSQTSTAGETYPTISNTPISEVPTSDADGSSNSSLPDANKPFAFLSMMSGNTYQLFAYSPYTATFLRLTDNPWNEITPALSPDGTHLAYSSDRDGFWDLYVLEFSTNTITRLTNTPDYDAAPDWSPDGKWLAYESYIDNNLDLQIVSAFPAEDFSIRLTSEASSDHSPAWSPDGRSISFVSNRSGDEEIWLADLNTTQDRFSNLSIQPATQDRDPNWSPDGKFIVWSSEKDGVAYLVQMSVETGGTKRLNLGSLPHYSPDGAFITSINKAPTGSLISTISAENGASFIIPAVLPAAVNGMTMAPGLIYHAAISSFESISEKLAITETEHQAGTPIDNQQNDVGLIALQDIQAPNPYLHAEAVDDFLGMRQQLEMEIGWNFLDHLENAFIPITHQPSPGMQNSWLYTGRAIAFNTSPLYGGWMCVVREDYYGETYWRVFLKARYQDGSQGMPIKVPVWDFSARYSGSPVHYENGGVQIGIPEGYWVDFTELASRYMWERLPALQNWRTYFSGTLFNQYIHASNYDWQTAMQGLYPEEALATSTRVPTRTLTPGVSPTSPIKAVSATTQATQLAQPSATVTPNPSPTRQK